MPRLVVAALVLALVATGALLAWPQVRGWWLYQRTYARILDVLPTPRANGTVELAIVYEYPLPQAPGTPGRTWQLGWRIGDAFFHPMADPVVEAARVEGVVRDLLDADLPERRLRRVFYAANDPEGTAFILDETAATPANRLQIGVVLIGIGLLSGVWLWRRRNDS